MARASVSACASLRAPCTSILTSLRAPSPSAAMATASSPITSSRALASRAWATGPAAPLASTQRVSLVEVSPSTEMRLKVRAAAAAVSRCSRAGAAAASVITKASMVARRG